MWWFATNTGTQNDSGSCRDTSCPAGFAAGLDPNNNIFCYPAKWHTLNGQCQDDTKRFTLYTQNDGCCTNGTLWTNKNKQNICCVGNMEAATPNDGYFAESGTDTSDDAPQACIEQTMPHAKYVARFKNLAGNVFKDLPDGVYYLACVSHAHNQDQTIKINDDGKIKCDGTFIYIDANGHQIDPHGDKDYMSFGAGQSCSYRTGWANWTDSTHVQQCTLPKVSDFSSDNITGWHVSVAN